MEADGRDKRKREINTEDRGKERKGQKGKWRGEEKRRETDHNKGSENGARNNQGTG